MTSETLDHYCPRINPARYPAILAAVARSKRENAPMLVFVGPPGSGCMNGGRNENVWFVRSAAEGIPHRSEFHDMVEPS